MTVIKMIQVLPDLAFKEYNIFTQKKCMLLANPVAIENGDNSI